MSLGLLARKHEELVTVAAAIIVAAGIIYLTAPALLAWVDPRTQGHLWRSPVPVDGQTLTKLIITLLATLLVVMTLVQRIRQARMAGEGLVPLWFMVIVGMLAATAATAWLVTKAAQTTARVLFSSGATCWEAVAGGVVVGGIVFWLFRLRTPREGSANE